MYVQVTRLGNISVAARALHLTQPTVSLQLKKLSEEVTEALFTSRNGRMELTHVDEGCITLLLTYWYVDQS